MSAEAPQPVQHRWCDVWVEQVAENPEQGSLLSRLHQRGQVVGRATDVLYVRFVGEGQLIGLSPRLLCLLPGTPGGC